jgi:hypothetical protein
MTLSCRWEMYNYLNKATPSHFHVSRNITPRRREIKTAMDAGLGMMISPEDTQEVSAIMIDALSETVLIPKWLYAACQGVLALNQASTTSIRAGGVTINTGSIKPPGTAVRLLMGYILILLPEDCRAKLQELVKFCCDVCGGVDGRERHAWARQIAAGVGPVVMHTTTKKRKGGFNPSEVAGCFFEVVMACHGLNAESQHSVIPREIWLVPDAVLNRVRKEMVVKCTPRRARSVTPYRTPMRCLGVMTSARTSRRNLFGKTAVVKESTLALCRSVYGDERWKDLYAAFG